MANVKIAISIQKSLFEQMEALSREMNIPRSHLYALALQEYIQRHQNLQLLERINHAYQDAPDASEQKRLRKMQHQQRKVVEGEW